MQGETTQFGIQRLVTGARCELPGCYEMALWLISYGTKTLHYCAIHTRATMREGYGDAGDDLKTLV